MISLAFIKCVGGLLFPCGSLGDKRVAVLYENLDYETQPLV